MQRDWHEERQSAKAMAPPAGTRHTTPPPHFCPSALTCLSAFSTHASPSSALPGGFRRARAGPGDAQAGLGLGALGPWGLGPATAVRFRPALPEPSCRSLPLGNCLVFQAASFPHQSTPPHLILSILITITTHDPQSRPPSTHLRLITTATATVTHDDQRYLRHDRRNFRRCTSLISPPPAQGKLKKIVA